MLVNIHGSKELFVNVYRSLLRRSTTSGSSSRTTSATRTGAVQCRCQCSAGEVQCRCSAVVPRHCTALRSTSSPGTALYCAPLHPQGWSRGWRGLSPLTPSLPTSLRTLCRCLRNTASSTSIQIQKYIFECWFQSGRSECQPGMGVTDSVPHRQISKLATISRQISKLPTISRHY